MRLRPEMSVPLPSEMCQFCLSNGENLEQCRSHQLKSASGLVSCPILRAFTCPSVRLFSDCLASLLATKTFNKQCLYLCSNNQFIV